MLKVGEAHLDYPLLSNEGPHPLLRYLALSGLAVV